MKRPHIGGRRVTMPCWQGAFPVSSMARLLLLAVVLLCFAVRATAQGAGDSIRTHSCGSIRTHSYMVGLGSTHQLDTYLSHLNYSGYQVSLLRETLRMTRLAGHRGKQPVCVRIIHLFLPEDLTLFGDLVLFFFLKSRVPRLRPPSMRP